MSSAPLHRAFFRRVFQRTVDAGIVTVATAGLSARSGTMST